MTDQTADNALADVNFDEFTYPCTTDSCAFCTLPVRENDTIVAINSETGELSQPSTKTPCFPGCAHIDGLWYAVHGLCNEPTQYVTLDICRVTATDYNLNETDEIRYETAVACELGIAQESRQFLNATERLEIRSRLRAQTKRLELEGRPCRSFGDVDLTEKVYATYELFHTHRFLATLSNTETDGSVVIYCPSQLLSPPTEEETPARAFVLRNQLGVLDVTICANNEDEVLRDGLKLRHIFNNAEWEASHPSTLWPKPMLSGDLVMNTLIVEDLNVKRYKLVKVNRDNCVGYSIGCNDCGGLIDIVAHRYHDDDYSYYQINGHHATIWSHFTIDRNEYIRDIWKRRHPNSSDYALVFTTTANRVHVAGVHPPQGTDDEFEYQLLARLERLPIDMYIENTNGVIAEMGFLPERSTNLDPSIRLCVPRALGTYPTTLLGRQHFRTSASLRGVHWVQPCFIGHVITGIVVQYTEGTTACLGHVVLEKLKRPIYKAPDENIIFASEPLPGNLGMCVTDITMARCDSVDRGSLVSVEAMGTLEWWFIGLASELIWFEHEEYDG
ncbi:hypothetical protein VHEMI01628 [[Torrubiella] hemipterigena]|uniref:Uncharacterized protein n=1 Tax=[Torrubiella] hemipterigena TaxID=1531966 RepID=A0A0A1STK4_9HYPO|nr:hypothetical protein VHEMI01628 [[Torrubiella] hemipterigena]